MQFGKLGDKVARFRQINMDRPNLHHDPLEFPDGQIVLVTRLCEGQRATVLQLPASARPVNTVEGKSAVRSSGNRAAHYRVPGWAHVEGRLGLRRPSAAPS